jgi:hypothetical protein
MPNCAEKNAVSPDAVLPAASTNLAPAASANDAPEARPREIGGPAGPEPTRFGDWERKGRCIDF